MRGRERESRTSNSGKKKRLFFLGCILLLRSSGLGSEPSEYGARGVANIGADNGRNKKTMFHDSCLRASIRYVGIEKLFKVSVFQGLLAV